MPMRTHTIVARKLRRDATDVERILWRALRERLPFWKFRRQHPIGRFIADFACPARKVVIELDGGQHAVQEVADAARSAEIAQYGYRVMRFWNTEVLENLEGVLQVVMEGLAASPPHPGPLHPHGAERGRASPQVANVAVPGVVAEGLAGRASPPDHSLSAPGGGEGWGEVGETPSPNRKTA